MVILTVNIQNDNYTDLVTQACKEMFYEVQSTLPDLTVRCSDGKFFHTHKQLFMLVDNDFRSVLISDPEIKNGGGILSYLMHFCLVWFRKGWVLCILQATQQLP